MDDIKIEIGKRIRSIRKELQMTQKEFATRIGMKTQYLSNVEKGLNGLTVEKILQICNLANISSDYLLFGIHTLNIDQLKVCLDNYSIEEISNSFEIIKNILYYLRQI